MSPLERLAAADKAIAFFPGWSKPESPDGYTHFLAPISINGITVADLSLSGGTYAQPPEKHVTFELLLSRPGRRQPTKLMRIDWRSLKGGHTNQRRWQCPPECAGKRVGETHFHAFDLNWLADQQRMRGPKLPCARDVEEELQSFESLRAYVGKHFRINNIELVTRPPWVYDLFPLNGALDDADRG
jgi:hypothetical protein